MSTVAELLRRADDLPQASARLDAELLLCHVLGKPRSYLFAWSDAEVEAPATTTYTQLLERRRAGEPVAHLLGEREFWSLTLKVTPDTLIPRPETETLVEWTLELDLPAQARVVDLGTGSGAIALALAAERPAWSITAIDVSSAALDVARENASRLDLPVAFKISDWFAQVAGDWDLVVSNPPYVAPGDAHLQQGDLRFEPLAALAADDDGLADLRTIATAAVDHLADGGWLLLEHGHDQGAAVRELLQQQGFLDITTRRDLAGIERITGGRRADR